MALESELAVHLQAENEQLRARIRELEEIIGIRLDAPVVLCLTGKEAQIFGALVNREMMTKQALMSLLYTAGVDEEPEIKIVDVFVCKLRAKLEPFGIDIQTIWGRGYAMSKENKAKAIALLQREGLGAGDQ